MQGNITKNEGNIRTCNLHLVLFNPPQSFSQIFGQVFDQIFVQGFDPGLGEGKNHKYSVQYYPS